jgi:pyridoxine kinase
VNNKGTLETIVKIVKELKEKNPDLKYFCDPVMGDGGELYKSVPPEMVDLYRTLVFPLAYSIKLNQTELEHLSKMQITSEEQAWKAVEALHAFEVEHVVVSSVDYLGADSIGILASTKHSQSEYLRYSMQVAKRNLYYTGTGDLFSALLLAWMHKQNYSNTGEAVQKVVSGIQHVLDNSNDEANERLKLKEIRLIRSASEIVSPTKLLLFKSLQ